MKHLVSTSNKGGNAYESFLTPICICGWEGKPVSCYVNYQMHDIAEQCSKHIKDTRQQTSGS